MKIAGNFVTCQHAATCWSVEAFWSSRCGCHLVNDSRDDGKFELAMRRMGEVDLVMFLMDVKLKIKHTSLKRRPISKAIMSGRYRFILPKFDGGKSQN